MKRRIHSIVLHHTAGGIAVSAKSIDRAHKRRKWRGIGYHRLITAFGGYWHMEKGRDLNRQGAHAGVGKNRGSIGISVCGNYVTMEPDIQVIKILYIAIYDLNQQFQRYGPAPCEPLLVIGHCDLKRTACPGNKLYAYIPSIRYALKKGIKPDDFIPLATPRKLAVDRPIGLRNLKTYKRWTRL